MGKQGHDDDHGLHRRASPGEDGACGGAEGLTAFFAEKALVLLCMDAEVTLADMASGMTSEIGAEDGGGIHHGSPPDCGCEMAAQEYAGIPVCFAMAPYHG